MTSHDHDGGPAPRWGRRIGVVRVQGPSMVPAFRPGDRLLVLWGSRRCRVGDAVVVRRAGLLTVKRLTAVSVDGGSVEVRGDNPLASTDSRDYGPVPRADLAGRVLVRMPAARRPATGRSTA